MRAWSLAVIALLLGGCATAPQPAPVGNPARAWRARMAELTPLRAWDVRGRMAVHTAHHGGEVSLRWVKKDQSYTIDLSGPLGHGLVRLQRSASGARLEDEHRHVYYAENAEELLFKTTGWRVPLRGLAYWIRGLPVPGVKHEQRLDDAGLLRGLRQMGWHIRFLAYKHYGRYVLPSDIELTQVAPAQGNRTFDRSRLDRKFRPVDARLLIERWAYLR